ncbi:MAG: addiction module protein [Nostoc sp. ChiQUE01a]|nr:addiction module protein [Nostoc sp. ChiQUE01a]
MDITATLNEIATLSVEDRIPIVQAIWDSIAAEQVYPDLTDAQKQELDRRIADSDSNPDNVLTWKEIKASIKGQQLEFHDIVELMLCFLVARDRLILP